MIKLQLLLRHPALDPVDDPALRALLAAHGLHVTACGRASISADIAPSDAEQLFGPIPTVKSGFAPDLPSTPALAIPADVEHAISLITLAPHQSPASQPS